MDKAMPAEPADRLAKNYRLVFDLIRNAGRGRHLRVQELFALARSVNPTIGQTTVYRAVIRLCDLGLISEILVPGGEYAYYEVAAESHAHLRCLTCGAISDVDVDFSPADAQAAALRQGVRIKNVAITLEGSCARCTSEEQAPS